MNERDENDNQMARAMTIFQDTRADFVFLLFLLMLSVKSGETARDDDASILLFSSDRDRRVNDGKGVPEQE